VRQLANPQVKGSLRNFELYPPYVLVSDAKYVHYTCRAPLRPILGACPSGRRGAAPAARTPAGGAWGEVTVALIARRAAAALSRQAGQQGALPEPDVVPAAPLETRID